MISDISHPIPDRACRPDADADDPSDRAVGRATGWWALAFAGLFVAGLLLVGSTPEYSVGAREYEAWFSSGGHRATQIGGVVALVLAGLAFVPTVRAASGWARSGSDVAERALDLALASIFATLLVVGAVVSGVASISVEIGGTPTPGVDVIRSAEQIGYGLVLFAASLVAAWIVGRLAFAAHRAGTWPRHQSIASVVAAVGLASGSLSVPVLLLPAWAIVTGVGLLRSPS